MSKIDNGNKAEFWKGLIDKINLFKLDLNYADEFVDTMAISNRYGVNRPYINHLVCFKGMPVLTAHKKWRSFSIKSCDEWLLKYAQIRFKKLSSTYDLGYEGHSERDDIFDKLNNLWIRRKNSLGEEYLDFRNLKKDGKYFVLKFRHSGVI